MPREARWCAIRGLDLTRSANRRKVSAPPAAANDGPGLDPDNSRCALRARYVPAQGLAFEMTRAALRLADGSYPVNKIIAEKIIEFAQGGERRSQWPM